MRLSDFFCLSGNNGLPLTLTNLQMTIMTNHQSPMKRGISNNNPLNIRHSADQWQGASETQTDKSFVQFNTMAYGYRAAWCILQTYYERFARRNQGFTVRNIISRWAPPQGERHRGLHPNGASTERFGRKRELVTTVQCG